MILRPYQSEMVDAIRERWGAGKFRVLGCLPTGGGKTEIAIEIITAEATPTRRVLIVVERKVLCTQWVDRLNRHGMQNVGILQGGNSTGLWAPVIVATAQSIRTRGIPEGVALVVIDESHIWHQTHDKVLEAAGQARVLGLTATPLREGLGMRFDTIVTGATIRSLIDDGYLVRPRYFAPEGTAVQDALDDVAIRAGDYASDQLSRAMRSKAIIGDVVGTWQRRGEDRQTIVFAVDKGHAADLCAEFMAVGIAAAVVVDETSDEDREAIFREFDARTVRVLVSVGVLSIGFDSPIASCAILARPTMSTGLHIQQGGRVLRPYEGKVDALILDHAANTIRHGKLEDFVPPDDLSMIDKQSDKKARRDAAEGWVCRDCQAINDNHDDICIECGMARRRLTNVVVLDGELVSVDTEPGEPLPGPTLDDIKSFYLMSRWHAASKGLSDGWAFYATQRRFKLDDATAKRVVKWCWRDLETMVPDAEAARWFTADFQRHRIASRSAGRSQPNA